MTWICKCKTMSLYKVSETLKNLSQEHRLQIICMLIKAESMCVCEIIEKLWIKQNLVSHHLKVLKDSELLNSEQKWKKIYYSINQEKYGELKSNLKIIFNI